MNEKLETGEIELRVTEHQLLNKCQQPPFLPTQTDLPGEDLAFEASLSRSAETADAGGAAAPQSYHQDHA